MQKRKARKNKGGETRLAKREKSVSTYQEEGISNRDVYKASRSPTKTGLITAICGSTPSSLSWGRRSVTNGCASPLRQTGTPSTTTIFITATACCSVEETEIVNLDGSRDGLGNRVTHCKEKRSEKTNRRRKNGNLGERTTRRSKKRRKPLGGTRKVRRRRRRKDRKLSKEKYLMSTLRPKQVQLSS